MADINHSSNIRSKHHQRRHHATTTSGNSPKHHDLIVSNRSEITIRNANSQTTLRRLHNVQSTASATTHESARILVAHDGRILAHDAELKKSTTFRFKGNDVSRFAYLFVKSDIKPGRGQVHCGCAWYARLSLLDKAIKHHTWNLLRYQ